MKYSNMGFKFLNCYFKGRFDNVIIFGEIFKLGGLKPEILRQGTIICIYSFNLFLKGINSMKSWYPSLDI